MGGLRVKGLVVYARTPHTDARGLQGYLAHKKQLPPLGPPQIPRQMAAVRSYGVGVSYERGTPLCPKQIQTESNQSNQDLDRAVQIASCEAVPMRARNVRLIDFCIFNSRLESNKEEEE